MSFKTALSGLNAAQSDLNVIGNNIANVSTYGFKKSRSEFVDVYAASYQGISRLQVGAGVRVAQVQQNMSQGLTTYTDNNLDLAIQGRGFFKVSDSGGTYYTRAGMFSPDNQGYVVNSRQQRLQVYPVNSDGVTFNTGTTTDLQIATSEGAPSATTKVDLGLNLNADATVPTTAPFDRTDPTSYNYSTSATVYDSLGSTHQATTFYVKSGPNAWNVYTTLDDPVDSGNSVLTGAGAGDLMAEPATNAYVNDQNVVSGPVPITFNPDGSLATVNGAATPTTQTYSFTIDNGAYDGPAGIPPYYSFDIDYGKATQYSEASGVTSLSQDGYATGLLTGIDVSDNGVVTANYTNGVSTSLGKVALANFQNPQGLQPAGDSTWKESYSSGVAQLGEPGTGNFGLMQGGALEDSNVNLSEELVSLIVAQRNFQANAQAITTENNITQTIIQMR